MGYRLFVKCENGKRFLSDINYATNVQAEKAREFVASSAGIKKDVFGITAFCDICQKETEIYEEGCCKHCFEKFVSSIRGGAKK